MAYHHSFRVERSGLILYLDAGNRRSYSGSGTNWNDISGNTINGTFTNGPIFNSSNFGNVAFDGVNDYISISHNNIFNFTTALSISCWFKTTQSVDAYLTTKSNDSFYFGIGPAGTTAEKLSFYGNGVTNWFQSNVSVNTGNWVNGVVTWNGAIVSLYVNGVLDNFVARGGTLWTGTNVLTVGARINSSPFNGYLNGNISNIMYYNRGLSASEVLQNYNALRGRFGL